jgi:hypothetical protein
VWHWALGLSPEEKAQVVEDSVNWIRNNESKAEDFHEPTRRALTNLAGTPMPRGKLTPAQ